MNNIRHSSEHTEHYTPEWLVKKARHVLGGIDLDPASSAFANEIVRATTFYDETQNGLLVPGGWRGRTILNPPGGLVDSSGNVVHRSTKGNVGGCTVTGSCGLPAGTVERVHIGGVPHDKVTPGHKHEGVTSSAVTWWRALCGEWAAGRVTAAIFVGFSIELLQSCQGGPNPGHHPLDFPCCFPKERIKFDMVKPNKTIPGLMGLQLSEDGFHAPGHATRVPGNQPTHSNVIVLLPGAIRQGDAEYPDPNMLSRFDEAFGPVGYIHRGNGQYA